MPQPIKAERKAVVYMTETSIQITRSGNWPGLVRRIYRMSERRDLLRHIAYRRIYSSPFVYLIVLILERHATSR